MQKSDDDGWTVVKSRREKRESRRKKPEMRRDSYQHESRNPRRVKIKQRDSVHRGKPNLRYYPQNNRSDKIERARDFRRQILAGERLDLSAYCTVFRLIPDYYGSLDWLERIESDGLEPDLVTFNSVMNKANTLKQAYEVLGMINEHHLKPNLITFNILISKAKT